jgi:hypothetical protein
VWYYVDRDRLPFSSSRGTEEGRRAGGITTARQKEETGGGKEKVGGAFCGSIITDALCLEYSNGTVLKEQEADGAVRLF